MPKFKVRRYGCKTLGKLYERLNRTAGTIRNRQFSFMHGKDA